MGKPRSAASKRSATVPPTRVPPVEAATPDMKRAMSTVSCVLSSVRKLSARDDVLRPTYDVSGQRDRDEHQKVEDRGSDVHRVPPVRSGCGLADQR